MTSERDYRPYTERCVSCGRGECVQQYGDHCARCLERERDALAARLRALGYNVTAIIEHDALHDPHADYYRRR